MSLDQKRLYHSKQHQRAMKLKAETQMAQVSVLLQGHLVRENKMSQRTRLVEARMHEQINEFKRTIDAFEEKKGHHDEVDKEIIALFKTYLDDIENLVHELSLGLKKDSHASKNLVKTIHKIVIGELEAELQDDEHDKTEQHSDADIVGREEANERLAGTAMADREAMEELSEEDRAKWEEAKSSLVTMITNLEKKLGTMGGVPMSAEKLKQWEALLEDSNSGKIPYSEGVKKMEALMNEPSHGPLRPKVGAHPMLKILAADSRALPCLCCSFPHYFLVLILPPSRWQLARPCSFYCGKL